MSYTIVRSDGNILTVIADNVIDTTSSPFSLPGRNFSGYGEPVDTNFVRSLENFANVAIPQNPIRGQFWYDISDPTNPTMRVCPQDGETDKTKWLAVPTTGAGGNLTLNPGNISVPNGNVDANNINASNLIQGRRGYFYSIDDSTSTTTGALQVVGGVGIGKNAHIGGNIYVSGNGTISGNLTVDGDITYINVTTLAIEDPIISQGNGPNNTPLTSNDGKDRGSALNYYDTAARVAFMGYDNSGAEFLLGKDVTIASDVVTAVGTYGNLRMGTLFASNISVPGANTEVLFNDLNGGFNLMNANASFTFNKLNGTVSANIFNSTIATGTAPFTVASTTRVSGLFVQGANEANIQAQTAGTYYLNFSSATSGNRLLNANNSLYVNVGTGMLYATTFSGNFLLPTGAAGNGKILWNNNGNVADVTGITTDNAGSLTLTGNLNATGNVNGGNINTSGVVIATGNITGGNLNTSGAVAAVGNVTGGNIKTTGLIEAVGNITGGNLITNGLVETPTLKAPAGGGTITGSWTLGPGTTFNATYADLAERHHADKKYPIGTVMRVGGIYEVTQVNEIASTDVLGVVSNTAAYIMNASAGNDDSHPTIGLIGRVMVRVIGSINKGDKIISAGNGCAMKMTLLDSTESSFGWSLENNLNTDEKLVLCVIK